MRMARFGSALLMFLAIIASAVPARAQAGAPVRYRVTIPEPEHHWLQVEVTFEGLGAMPLRARMSRSSPGRYAVHEFAKNVFHVEAWDASGRALAVTRPDVDEWHVEGHGGAVRLVYQVFGDQADGTYMAVDTTHAHLNMPATFMWGVGLDARPIAITFTPPQGSGWTVGTQLFPTADPFAFTAPNLQYFLDSPTEMARLIESTFEVLDGGRPARFRLLAHADAAQADLDALARLVERLVREQRAVFGAFPVFEPGSYTFLLDYVPWADGDAMEHRNSTYISDPGVSIRTPAGRTSALDAISHEFFHVWNVERIRPAGLEPFDFTRENITCCLWLAEGFTQYYGPLLLRRAGLVPQLPLSPVSVVMNSPARALRSPVEMSEHGPFADAGVANDVHDRSRSFISYYTDGAALAFGLDLMIRERTSGRLSLDDYMRRLWERFGAVAGAAPPPVGPPHTATRTGGPTLHPHRSSS
jgi:predicted metalloprotease with PDZ domain